MKLIRFLITVSALVMFAALFSLTASAVDYSYNINNGNINIKAGTGGQITVTQTSIKNINATDTITITGNTTTNTIIVEPGVSGVKIILSGVSIDVSNSGDDPRYSKCAFDIGDGSAVDLTMSAGTTNTFKSGITKAGIKVEQLGTGAAGSIVINGPGTLIAIGGSGVEDWAAGSGAGIGSNGILFDSTTVPSGGNITINSGTITATGGTGITYCGAGIGGGGGQSYFHSQVVTQSNAPNAGSITIHGGTVTATGGSNSFSGPGIGGGSGQNSGTMGTVLIDGGTVTARSGNGIRIASGIGYGFANSVNLVRQDPASITISGNAVVNASSSNGTSVYAAIGHNDNGSITISGTATVTATKGTSTNSSDLGTISCNNLTISNSPSITVYSPNKQGDQCSIGNSGWPKDAVKPIYAKSTTSSVPIIAGIFPSPPIVKTIILTGGEPSTSKTIVLPDNYSSFAATVSSAGTYSGAMGIDVLQNSATLSQTFNINNAVNTFNVKQLDITPPAAPGIPAAAAGPDINAQEESSGVGVAVPLGGSGALVKDAVELLLGGESFSTPVKHVLTSAEITANTCTLTIPATMLGEDGVKSITARVIDEAGNVGPAGASLTLNLDTTAPAAPADVQVFPIGGTVVTNVLNLTNINLTATASIVAQEAAGGYARLYINGVLKATDITISAEDTQVTFDLGQSTAAGLQSAVETGGTVTIELFDFAGNKSNSLINNPTLTIDYTAPSVDAVNVPVAASYKAERNLDFTIRFSETVLVSGGVPYIQLALETGGTVNAGYLSGSGTSELVFRYTVSEGDNDTNGIQIVSAAVNLNGCTIRDTAGNDANLTLLNVGDTDGILVDTTAPVVMSVGVPAAATYKSNQNLDFIANFNENVVVNTANGIPAISVTLSTGGRVSANYLSGSGSSALTFRYTVLSGNLDSDGIDLGTEISLNGSSIQDAAGNNALLGLSGVGGTSEVKVDAVPPAIISAAISPSNKYIDISFSKGVYGAGALTADKLALTFIRNSGNASLAAISSIKKNDNEAEGLASALSGGETTVRVFISIKGTPSGLETVEIRPASALSVYDSLGNAMVADETSGVIVLNDRTAPKIDAVNVPVAALYKAGQNLDFTISFSETVLVSGGVPYIQLALETGGTVNAGYLSGSGTSELVFRYTVSEGDNDTNGIQIVSAAVNLNGCTIRDTAGNDANLTLLNVGDTDGILVDTTAPVVMSVGVPAAATYKSNQNLNFIANFNENVVVNTVNGIPAISLTLSTGGRVSANYLSGSGSSALTFRYAVLSGNLDSDGIDLGTEISLNGSSIQDAAGNNALLGLSGVGGTSEVKVDAVSPAIDSAAISLSNKYIDISFSKGVYGAGALTADKLALTFMRNSGNASLAAISSIKKNDSEAEGLASALTGGETTVRVFISITGTPSGLETVEIRPASALSVYDILGNAMAADETSGIIVLNDRTAPTVDALETITASDATSDSVYLAWPAAADEKTAVLNLQYKVVYSLNDNISTVIEAQNNGTLAKNWTVNLTTFTAAGLNACTSYYFNVLVKDEAGNIAAYTTATMTTSEATYHDAISPDTGDVQILINGEEKSAGSFENWTNMQGQSVTTVILDTDKLHEILRAQDGNALVTISAPTGTDVTEAVFAGDMVDVMEENGATLVIQTQSATYSLPASEININAILKQYGENVTLADIKLTVCIAEPHEDTVTIIRNAAEDGGFALVAPAVDFTISCSYNGIAVDVSSFSSYVERTLAIPDGIDPSKITTAIVVEPDGSVRHVPTIIIEKDGKYYAKINSLTNSTYTVIYNPVRFSDVENHWAKDSINDMGSRMIVSGVGDGFYQPDRNITRAEFAAIVVKALGLKQGSTESGFEDVTLTDWFNGYVETATAYLLINGYDSRSYGPGDAITREQAMTMIARAMKLTGLRVSLTDSEASTILSAYTDGANVSSYAQQSAALCLKTGVVTGKTASTISPKDNVTRAEVAVMVQRLMKKSGLF